LYGERLVLHYKRKDSLIGAVFSILLKGGNPMQREHWRKVLKLRAIAQTIAAIVSAIAAIHQLLKK